MLINLDNNFYKNRTTIFIKNMPVIKKLSIFSFAIGLLGIVVLQCIYSAPRPVIMPIVPVWLGPAIIWGYLFNLGFVFVAAALLTGRMAKQAALLFGAFMLVSFLFFHTPAVLSLYPNHFGSWTDALKALALSGAGFVIAGFYPQQPQGGLFRLLDKMSPVGPYFFGIMMVIFGYDHFIYLQFVETLVPAWMPGGAPFWTYFAGAALMAGGLGMILNIRLAGILSGAMIFLWFILLHIPRAFVDPHGNQSNEWTSVFEALAFSGVAYLIGTKPKRIKGNTARQGIAITQGQGRAAV